MMQQPSPQWYYNDPFASGPQGRCRGVAALLAIFLGSLGIHYFYLNKIAPALTFLLVTVCSCGYLGIITGILALIQGIMFFCMSNQEFEQKFQGQDSFPMF